MNIREFSSQFTIYLYSANSEIGASAKVLLAQAGYDAFFFQDLEMLEQRIRDTAPHILVFSPEGMAGSLNDFLSHILEINFEIKFVLLAAANQFDSLAQLNSQGIVDVLSDELLSLDSRIVWAVDRACEKIFLTYQNEQLFDDLQEAKSRIEEVHSAAVISMKQVESKPPVQLVVTPPETLSPPSLSPKHIPLAARSAEYRSSESKEELIQKFLNHLDNSMCLFFKFLPTVRSFVAASATGISVKDIQGVGVQLDSTDLRDLSSMLAMGQLPKKFESMLVEAFQLNPPKSLPLYANGILEGVFIYSGSLKEEEFHLFNEEFALFSICYGNFVLEKKVSSLEVQDFVTELYNRSYYQKMLSDEVTRARRLKHAISVIKICLDDFYEIESSLGEIVRDELLKSVAQLIIKSSRANDVNCRTGLNEFSLILPHCNKKGAALRAERIRRMIEATSLVDNGMKLSLSLGISEYPTLCDSSKTLEETSTKALKFISEKSGNKICLFKAPDSHKPEYEVSQD